MAPLPCCRTNTPCDPGDCVQRTRSSWPAQRVRGARRASAVALDELPFLLELLGPPRTARSTWTPWITLSRPRSPRTHRKASAAAARTPRPDRLRGNLRRRPRRAADNGGSGRWSISAALHRAAPSSGGCSGRQVVHQREALAGPAASAAASAGCSRGLAPLKFRGLGTAWLAGLRSTESPRPEAADRPGRFELEGRSAGRWRSGTADSCRPRRTGCLRPGVQRRLPCPAAARRC